MSNTANLHTCNVCGQGFILKKTLTNHLLAHSGTKCFACNYCPRTFTRMANLRQHLLTDCAGQPHVCETCGKAFSLQTNLQKHVITHTGEKKHTCVLCERTFRDKASLQVHLRTHTGEKPYSCDVCGNSFSHVQHYNQHIDMHTRRECVCDVCSEVFPDEWNRRQHVQSEHRPHTCDLCERSFSHKCTLKRHILSHRRNAPHFYPESDLCELAYSAEEPPEACVETPPLNEWVHNEEKPHVCKVCQKAFAQGVELSKHYLTHTSKEHVDQESDLHNPIYSVEEPTDSCGEAPPLNKWVHNEEKPHVCEVCRKAFAEDVELSKHYLTHTSKEHVDQESDLHNPTYSVEEPTEACGEALPLNEWVHNEEKPHVCEVCRKAFAQDVELSKHYLTHTSEQHVYQESDLHELTYSIEDPPKTCVEAPPLNNWVHNEEKPHVCEVCQKAFAQGVELSKHYLTHTSKEHVGNNFQKKQLNAYRSVEKQYVCRDCRDTLFQSGQFDARLYDTPTEKPYICRICRRAIEQAGSVNRQILNDEGKPNACHLCYKSYASNRYLKMHLKTHHVDK